MRRPVQRRRGVAHVEFALLLPILMMFLYGIMEYGWMFFNRTVVQEAGRQGCRHGSTLNVYDHDIEAEVSDRMYDVLSALGVNCDTTTCEIDVEVIGEVPTQRLQCSLAVDYTPLINAVPTASRLSAGYLYYLEVQ